MPENVPELSAIYQALFDHLETDLPVRATARGAETPTHFVETEEDMAQGNEPSVALVWEEDMLVALLERKGETVWQVILPLKVLFQSQYSTINQATKECLDMAMAICDSINCFTITGVSSGAIRPRGNIEPRREPGDPCWRKIAVPLEIRP